MPLMHSNLRCKWKKGYFKTFPKDKHRHLECTLQLRMGVEYLHFISILHRDIKPAHILCYNYENGFTEWKFADFGASKIVQPAETSHT